MKFFGTDIDRVTTFVLVAFGLLFLMSYFPKMSFSGGVFGDFTIKSFDLTSDIHEARVASSSTTTLDHVIDTIVGGKKTVEPVTEPLVPKEKPEKKSNRPVRDEELMLKSMESNAENKLSVLFEDFSPNKELQKLTTKLDKKRLSSGSMRIAFLGDSFIEADILTADVRDILQSIYGGVGVGFVPMASPASKSRSSVEHESSGWKTFSMINYKTADWKRLTLNGFYYVPAEGASVSVKTKKKGKEYASCRKAQLLFVNEKNATLKVSINGEEPRVCTPPSDASLQTLDFTGDIRSISFSVSNVAGFYGYGVILNNENGIYVDNYSVRGSSGIVLSTADKELSKAFGKILPPDVIVLQYGLNVASANITNYGYYKKKMTEVINQLSTYFPEATFVVMGVGDRAMKNGSTFETMPGILAMVEVQREIAREAKCLFWDTFSAMGGKNSMHTYVLHNPPLANKDYTHINHAGGKKIANAFVFSILKEVEAMNTDTVAMKK